MSACGHDGSRSTPVALQLTVYENHTAHLATNTDVIPNAMLPHLLRALADGLEGKNGAVVIFGSSPN